MFSLRVLTTATDYHELFGLGISDATENLIFKQS